MSSLKRHEGYLMIDHRFSPGVPADVARSMGLDPRFMGEGKVMETATIHCGHCLGVVVKNPNRIRERGYCRHCDHYICDACDAQRHLPGYVHASGEKIIDVLQNAAAKGQTLGSPDALLSTPKIFVP